MRFIEVYEGRTKASLVRLGRCIALERGMWREVFPIEDLEGRIHLYRRLCDRKSDKYRRHYIDTLLALERVQQGIDAERESA